MPIISYEMMRTFSSEKEEDLLELKISDREIQFFFVTSIFLLGLFCLPQISYAMEKLKKLPKNVPEEFFYENGQKFQKLYKEQDFRTLKKEVKTKMAKIVKSIKSAEKEENIWEEREKFQEWARQKRKMNEVIPNVIPLSNLSRLNALSQKIVLHKMFYLQGGFVGYLLGKISEKLGSRAEKWISNKFDNEEGEKSSKKGMNFKVPLETLIVFLTKNPAIMALVMIWGYKYGNSGKLKKLVKTTLPPPLTDLILGEKRGIRYYFLKSISLRQPYIYFLFLICFIIAYRAVFYKFLKREMTPGDVITHITKGFLDTNAEIVNKLHELSKDFSSILIKAEKRSFDTGQQATKEKTALLENNINECKNEKFTISEEAKSLTSSLNDCSATYNLLKGQASHFIDELSYGESMKTLEFEVKNKLKQGDARLLLAGSELVEQIDYKNRFDEIYESTRKKNLRILEENVIPKIFENEKKTTKK
jgi:hypothetical protein